MPTIRFCVLIACVGALSPLLVGCASLGPPRGVAPRTVTMETTAYCACGRCCNWERSWRHLWQPTIASGPREGMPKTVGITASGTEAHQGTIAADTRYYPFGTIMYVSGYGYGRVEDTGGAIKGPARLDLFFDSHQEALQWGRRRVSVNYWK